MDGLRPLKCGVHMVRGQSFISSALEVVLVSKCLIARVIFFKGFLCNENLVFGLGLNRQCLEKHLLACQPFHFISFPVLSLDVHWLWWNLGMSA